MEEIKSISDIHKILLEIAEAFVNVCERHGIRYFMIGGTMLGAIRHKGFIPWDDDMDFGVNIEDYERLQGLLHEELPYPYRCITFEDSKYVKYPFLKIQDCSTCVIDKTVDLSMDDFPGLNIDIFPVFSCKRHSWKTTYIKVLMKLNALLFLESPESSRWKNSVRNIVRLVFRGVSKEALNGKLLSIACSMKGDCKGNLFGRWQQKETFPKEMYDQLSLFTFEDTQLYGIKQYDDYLRQMYGAYMTLPPKDKRLVHLANVFKKDETE